MTTAMDRVGVAGVEVSPDHFIGGERVASLLDHRIAMAMAVAGMHAARPVAIDDASPIATSYPDFIATAQSLGAQPKWLNA